MIAAYRATPRLPSKLTQIFISGNFTNARRIPHKVRLGSAVTRRACRGRIRVIDSDMTDELYNLNAALVEII